MKNLVKAELLKWRTTRSLAGHALGMFLIVVVSVVVGVATAGKNGSPGLDTTEGLRGVFAGAASGGFLVLTMGIITTAGEYRHNTITPALLITPHRGQLIAAKAIAMGIIGAAVAAISTLVTLAIALPWLSAKDVHVSLLSHDVGIVLLGCAAITVLFGLIGVGVGAIVRNQITAIVGTLMWLLVVEQLFVQVFPAVGKWVSWGACESLTGSLEAGHTLLPVAAAALLLAAYATTFVGVGIRLTARRDITA